MYITHHISRILFYLYLLLVAISLPTHGEKIIDSVVAVVNQQAITLSELRNELVIREIKNPSDKVKAGVLLSLIEQRLMLQEAEKVEFPPTPEKVDAEMQKIVSGYDSEALFRRELQVRGLEYEALVEWIRARMILEKWIERQFGHKILDEDIEQESIQYYEQHKSEFMEPVKVRYQAVKVLSKPKYTSQQQVRAKQLAEDIYLRLREGVAFRDIQPTDSIRINNNAEISGAQGVGLTLSKLKVGELSKPILTPEGYLIAKLLSKVPPRQKKYEQVSQEISELLIQSKINALLEAWLKEQRKVGDIRILHPKLARVLTENSATGKSEGRNLGN
jgi:parvulin-like peptidyl-prolyl isomerase